MANFAHILAALKCLNFSQIYVNFFEVAFQDAQLEMFTVCIGLYHICVHSDGI